MIDTPGERDADYAEMIVDTLREGLLVLSTDLHVRSANHSFYKTFQVRPEETLGQLVYELGNGQWNIPELRRLLEEVLPENKAMDDFEVEHDFEEIGRRTMLLNARQLDHHQLILLAIEDVTERKQMMRELKALNDELEERVAERTRQVRRLATKLTRAEQGERRRISQVLHDDLQQHLYGVHIRMNIVRQAAESQERERLLEHLSMAEEWLLTAIEITRQLTVDLSPPVLQEGSLAEALAWLAQQMEEMYGLEVELKAAHAFSMPDEDLRVLLFQIVRELLFNVVKHAGTAQATVELGQARRHLVICVSDEGRGFDVEEAARRAEQGGGFGLFSVRERLRLFGGRVEIDSAPGEGTRVRVYAPEMLEESTRPRS